MTAETGQTEPSPSAIMLEAAREITCQTGGKALLVHFDHDPSVASLKPGPGESYKIVLITQKQALKPPSRSQDRYIVRLPDVPLTRMGLVKMATLYSFSQGILRPGEPFVILTGSARAGLDTILRMTVGEEFELLQTVSQPALTEHIRRAVFQKVLNLATSLAVQGREGHPVGALFVLGDSKAVLEVSKEMILNPFHGYPPEHRQILDEAMIETIREYSALDGAVVIKGNGVVESAGTYLRPGMAGDDLPQGLGARHATAAAITASTRSIAITVSQSTGTVRVWRGGTLITEIEKAQRQPGSILPGPKPDN